MNERHFYPSPAANGEITACCGQVVDMDDLLEMLRQLLGDTLDPDPLFEMAVLLGAGNRSAQEELIAAIARLPQCPMCALLQPLEPA